MVRKAKIIVKLEGYDCRISKNYIGTEDEIYLEAHDYMTEIIRRYINDNEITNTDEVEKIVEAATHIIVLEEEVPTKMFAIIEDMESEPVILGVYATRAEAEEMVLTECDNAVYEIMNQCSAMDVFGIREYDYKMDYKYLMRDTASTMSILEVPVFATMREN